MVQPLVLGKVDGSCAALTDRSGQPV